MSKPRPNCVAFVYGNQEQKAKLLVLADQANLSVSSFIISLIEKQYQEHFGDIDPSVLVQHPGS